MFEHTTIYIAFTKRPTFAFFNSTSPRFPAHNLEFKGIFSKFCFPSKGHKYILEKESGGALFCFITSLAPQCILFHHYYDHPPKIEMPSIKKMRNREQTCNDSSTGKRKCFFPLQLSLMINVA